MKRHEVLGFQIKDPVFIFGTSLPQRLADYQSKTAPSKHCQQFPRYLGIQSECKDAALQHLGVASELEVNLHLNRGMDYCIDYYLGTWWKQEPDPEIVRMLPSHWRGTCEADAMALDKTRPDRELKWFDPLPYTFMLGGLTNRWSDVVRVCEWFDETFEMQYQAGTIDDEFMLLFLCMALQQKKNPPACLGDMVNVVQNAKPKRTKLLCAAWEAAIAGNQTAFDKAFADGLKIFVSKEMDDGSNVMLWMAVKDTAVWAIAERNGLKFPKLNDKCEAVVMRRETIGLG